MQQPSSSPSSPQATSSDALLRAVKALTACLENFEPFTGTPLGEMLKIRRTEGLSLARGKLLPELKKGGDFPLMVALLGGTNTGKSTLFNALAGQLLSEARITASATRHPLLFLHRDFESILEDQELFDEVTVRPLSSSGELLVRADTPLLFYRLHEQELLRELAFFDTPDLDSIEQSHHDAAHWVMTRADLCLFVTTPQKYKDRILVEELERILSLQRQVLLLFNLVDDEMIYQTMLDDLRARLGDRLSFGAWLRRSEGSEPALDLKEAAWNSVQDFLTRHPRTVLKTQVKTHSLDALITLSQSILEDYRDQTTRKEELLFSLNRGLEEAMRRYEQQSSLSFPEIGVALTQHLEATALRRLFTGIASSDDPRLTAFAGQLFGLTAKPLRRGFLRSFELPSEPPDWAQFWRRRDEQDLQQLRSCAQLLRASIEQALRLDAAHGAISMLLLERFFNAESLDRFDQSLERRFWETIEREISVGQELVQGGENTNAQDEGLWRKSWCWISNGLKAISGLFLAWLTGGFGLLDLIFFPAGFIGGAWLLAAGYWRFLRRKETLFLRQRRRQARELFDEVQLEPLRSCVHQLASRQELLDLERCCETVKKARASLGETNSEVVNAEGVRLLPVEVSSSGDEEPNLEPSAETDQ